MPASPSSPPPDGDDCSQPASAIPAGAVQAAGKSLAEKRALLKRMLEEKARAPQSAPPSFAQERLWILEQLSPGSSTYVELGAARMPVHLDAVLLGEMLNEIVARHEVLRTTFALENGKPVQRIAPKPSEPQRVAVVDLRQLPTAQREEELLRCLIADARQPFDLTTGPLLRLTVYQLGEADEVLSFALHHIIADGWSLGLFISELFALSLAFSEHRPSPLPPLTYQYRDFARWQRDYLQGAALEKHLGYWRKQLAGVQPLDLPSDRPRPATRAFRGARVPFELNETATAALRDLSRREQVTLYTTLLTAFQVLLQRYATQHEGDIVVGSPVAGRTTREIEPLIGFFVNMMPIRTDLSGNPRFGELLQRVRTTCLDALTHEELPFDKIVDELQGVRDPSRNPIFQVVLALHRSVWEATKILGTPVQPIEVDNGTSKYDLTLFLWEGAKELTGYLEYDTDLFDRETIVRLGENFKALVAAVIAAPKARIGDYPLVCPAERRQVLAWSGDANARFAQEDPLATLFERQAAQTPAAIALSWRDEQLSYGELNRRANQLAHHLAELGVCAGTPVAMYMDRSLEMVVGILAILKAGGYYVPIDPAYPEQRAQYMLADCAAPVAIASQTLVDRLAGRAIQVVCPERDAAAIAARPDSNPPCRLSPESLAYVIYTSGSTGNPKGVMVQQNHVARLFTATDDWYRFGPHDVWTLFHSYAFDFSVWELWGALLYGGRLVVVPYETSRSPAEFHRLCAREGVTVLNQTPSAFNQFIEADAASGEPLALRSVIFGGEALEFARLRPWFERHGDARPQLVNMYGITETTVHVTYRPVTLADAVEGHGSEVGAPIPDLQIYLLDAHLNPVPIGVPGEICVGGDGVARGYLNRPELTAQRFVPDPFATNRGARLYRSGDLARWRADGELEYLGRIDLQVKIRGFRIELGEIEAALEHVPEIRQAVVIAREDSPGEKRLVGYIVPTNGHLPGHNDLRTRLRTKLPDYMVPAAFVRLDAIPLTTNGKVDRKALPAPDGGRPELDVAFVAPTSPLEESLAAIWKEVLGVERVGIEDNFFELGGDSILAIQVVSKANQAGLGITAAHIFQYQTIARLATVAELARPIAAEQGLVTGPLPLTPIERWFFAQELPEPHHYNQAVLLHARRRLELDPLRRAVAALLAHHDALRLRFERTERGWEQSIVGEEAANAAAIVTQIDLASLPPAEQEARLAEEAARVQASFNLQAGPLMRSVLFELGADRPQRLLLAVHHLAVDGVSWRVLLEDLQLALVQVEQNRPATLPPKTTSLKLWAERLREFAQSETLAAQAEYWLGALSPASPPLPVDRAGDNTEASAATVAVSLTEPETTALLQEAPAAYKTQINELLLAAAVEAFAPWLGERTLLVDLEGHGRETIADDLDLSRTVGWFTTIYPARLALAGTTAPGETIQAVKEQLRRIPAHGLSYGLLRYLRDDAKLAGRLAGVQQAEVLFNYLGQFDQLLPEGALFDLTADPTGPLHSPRGRRPYLLEINSAVTGGRLEVHFTYSTGRHEKATIEALAQRYITALRDLIAHCQSPDAGGYSPADFPKARLSQQSLDKLLKNIRSAPR